MSTALITGCSSGIGRHLAHEYAQRRFDLVVVARRESLLRELADELAAAHGTTVHVLAEDLSDPDGPQRVFDAVEKEGIGIDALVNNAAIFCRGRFAELEWQALRDQHQLMTTTPAHLIHLFLPGMLARERSWIVNIASLATVFPGSPKMGLYGPAKAYLHRLTEGLASEYANSGVSFTVMIVGMVDTDILEASGTLAPVKQKAPFLLSEPSGLARRIVDASLAGKVVEIDGPLNGAAVAAIRHLPLRFGYRAMNPDNPVMRCLGMSGDQTTLPPHERKKEKR